MHFFEILGNLTVAMKFSIAVSILLSASSAAAFQARLASSGAVSRKPLHAVAMDPFTIAAAPKARQERVEIDMTGVALSVSMPLAEARINSLLTYTPRTTSACPILAVG